MDTKALIGKTIAHFDSFENEIAIAFTDGTYIALNGVVHSINLPAARARASDRESVRRKRILCADGFSISVQASSVHYCEPRDNRFANIRDYELVECGYPEGPDGCEHEVPQWFEKFRECGDSKVFPYVPIMKVMELIDAHGGRVEGGEIVKDY